MINKIVASVAEAISHVKDGCTLLCAGFGAAGMADELIEGLLDKNTKDLVIVANNAGTGDRGLAALIAAGRVRKVICSYPRTDKPHVFEAAFKAKRLELELVPQGTLSERMRCAAAGLGGFYSPVGVGTRLAESKEVRTIDGRQYVLELPLRGDVALCKALKADRWGNLIYRKAARNFNPTMAMAADITIVQVREIVELGELDAESIHTPGIFVDRVVQVSGVT